MKFLTLSCLTSRKEKENHFPRHRRHEKETNTSLGVENEKRPLAAISSDEKREEGAEELPSRDTS